MVTQPWVKLKRLIRDLKQDYPESVSSGPHRESGIDVYWDGTGLTIEVCRDPSHVTWRRHAHRGLWSKWISSDEESGEAVVSQE